MKSKKILSMILAMALMFSVFAGALQVFADREGSVKINPISWYDADDSPYEGYAYFSAEFTPPDVLDGGPRAYFAWSVINSDTGLPADDAFKKSGNELEVYFLENGNYTVSVVVTYNGETFTDSFDFVVRTPVFYGKLAIDIRLAEEIIERGNDGKYTEETWANFVAAYETAKAVLTDRNSLQEDVNEADANLLAATKGLRLINYFQLFMDRLQAFFQTIIDRIREYLGHMSWF